MKRDRLRIVFMGTPQLCLPCLDTLINEEDIIAVITQPDRPRGRGRKAVPPPVKIMAQEKGIPVFQPTSLKESEFLSKIKTLDPDLGIVMAYGMILPKELLDIPRYGFINIHASLLPKYRGAAPINWAIINGEKKTGITIIQMDEGLDTGDIILKKELEIEEGEDAISLAKRLSELAHPALKEALTALKENRWFPRPQDESLATYAPAFKKEDGRVRWELPAISIWRRWLGMKPWPGTYTSFKGKTIKIEDLRPLPSQDKSKEPGKIVKAGPDKVIVTTGDGLIEIGKLQQQGRKMLDARTFLLGFPIKDGEFFE